MMSAARLSQGGLRWEETLFGLVPKWTREVSTAAVESVCRQKLNIGPGDACAVTFHAAGLFNKIYLVQCTGRRFIMRISLPVYPRHKTRAEVATLRWCAKNTDIPVPEVFNFDDNNKNEIGYEWILMEFMPGTPVYRRWRKMTMKKKIELVQRIATFQVELSNLFAKAASVFTTIGTLDLQDAVDREDSFADPEKVSLGCLVSHEFFMGDHIHYNVQRGPFDSSHDWLSAVLNTITLHQTMVLDNSDDEDERDEAKEILPVALKLLSLLPKTFPPTLEQPETTGLYHHDLHLNNILVNEEGEVTAILDWECVSAMPLWVLTMVPKFLDGEVREEEPQRDLYSDETPEEAAVGRDDPDYLDSEGKNMLYFIHQMEYETTQLRKVYEAKVRELWLGWPLEESRVKVEFLKAISQCDGVWVKKAGRWADRIEKGEFVRFADA